ncbi:43398_t:CDS:2, partial [Gigaspora margarita]
VIFFVKEIMNTSYYSNDKRLYNELNGHFFIITDPSVQEIIDDDYEFSAESWNEQPPSVRFIFKQFEFKALYLILLDYTVHDDTPKLS